MQEIKDRAASLAGLALERDAIFLYDALAKIEKDPARRSAFERIATSERRHAAIWEAKLLSLGEQVPASKRPSWRVRQIALLARLFGTRAVSDMVKALEGYEEGVYGAHGDVPEVTDIAADEAKHAEIWRELDTGKSNGAHRAALAETKAREPWHRAGNSGTLRAIIFGVSDGLVSNAALVMGIAGAVTASGQGSFVVLAGVAGLLAGAFSMAAGEYVSMRSQTELLERQIELERAELEAMPEEEEAEIAAIYRARGFPDDEAKAIAKRLMGDPKIALETLVREELGLDPEELGSPWGAALGSFFSFAIGALVPLLPFILLAGTDALFASIGLTALALFGVGAAVSLLTGKSAIYTGLRQLAIGAAAAAITYAVGSLIGVNV
jgi:vacuolar iron transporter family protein|uniref:VIT1/CCC1 transporter family protein n=1 Tax=Candidatus Limnocylindrus sp. TaxID=2802978 RepID=UPI00404BA23F